ncbi:cysteine hydrolase [Roseomonas gilardii subsp. gilardii]|uniref:isochorismatase family protein n=1 Tax=Roseomonas gilardii TaxID=257708 RepID=UPI001FFAC554|nr:isochorismatase family cysteine hydrolase [Roseomonas gilardii]UPG73401.1 cysteine hydrolase [Roseomonas gilardii subsp. gilardii]
MHKIAIPQSIVDRVIARRGTAHPFAELDPKRTALVVVDLQNGFMRADLGFAPVPAAVEIVPAVNRLAAALRCAGGEVFWIRNTFNERSAREWSVMEEFTLPERREARARAMSEGTPGHELWPELEVKPEDTVLRKYRYSAFIQGSSDLPRVLREKGLDTVLITGTMTNVCCESSARDAMMLNFRTIMVSDANATLTDEEHNASLINFYATFGDVLSVAEIEESLDHATRRAAT